MNFEKEVDPYNVDTLLTLSEYCTFQNRFLAEANEELDTKMEEIAEEIATEALDGRKYNIYSDKEKAIFYALGYQKNYNNNNGLPSFFFFFEGGYSFDMRQNAQDDYRYFVDEASKSIKIAYREWAINIKKK